MGKNVLQGEGYTVGFSSRQITPWGGFSLLKQMLDHCGFFQAAKSWGLPLPGSNRGFDPVQQLTQFMVSVWAGACRFSHIEMIRFDEALKRLFGWEIVGERKSFSRFFERFTQRTTEEVQANIYQWSFGLLPALKSVTLDIDTTVITRYGKAQEGSAVGFNPKKKGRGSHHPLIAFVAEAKMVANFWLRPGNTSSLNNFIPFLQSTLYNLRGKIVSLIRADSGFYSNEILTFLETEKIDYVVSVKLYQSLQRKLYNMPYWHVVEKGIEVCEFMYRGDGMPHARRYIAVRQSTKIRPDAPGKNLTLFGDDPAISKWRFGVMVTSLKLSPVVVWRMYRGRADSENRIKELKADFGLDAFNLKDFWATEAALVSTMLAYNLMSLFRQAVLRKKTQHTLATLHGMLFAVGAFWDPKSNAQGHLLLCISRKKRAWFIGLWNQASQPPNITEFF